jgi:hypothetical protein
VAENSKYHTEMQKIQSHDKALKDVVDAYTKQLVDDLDHRWNKLNRFIQEETCNLATLLTEKTA